MAVASPVPDGSPRGKGRDLIQAHVYFELFAGKRRQTMIVRTRILDFFDRSHGLRGATRGDVIAFLSRTPTVQTRVVYLLALQAFYRWQVVEGHRPDNPCEGLPRPRIPRRQPRPIADADLTIALAAPEPLRSWFTLAAFAGLRACEIAPLRGDDLRDGMLRIREGKGGHTRTVPAHQLVVDLITARGTSGPLWGDYHAKSLANRANRWLHRNGITSTLHSLRHWSATSLLEACGNLRVVQEFLGHQDPASTAVYTLVTPGRMKVAVDQLQAPVTEVAGPI